MDGYDAAARIRRMKDEKKASIPIIAMTANGLLAEDRQKAISMGMNHHGKPIEECTFTGDINIYVAIGVTVHW